MAGITWLAPPNLCSKLMIFLSSKKMLRDAGITVVVGLLAEEAVKDLGGFFVNKSGESVDRNDE